jgi:hypothetical protein
MMRCGRSTFLCGGVSACQSEGSFLWSVQYSGSVGILCFSRTPLAQPSVTRCVPISHAHRPREIPAVPPPSPDASTANRRRNHRPSCASISSIHSPLLPRPSAIVRAPAENPSPCLMWPNFFLHLHLRTNVLSAVPAVC